MDVDAALKENGRSVTFTLEQVLNVSCYCKGCAEK